MMRPSSEGTKLVSAFDPIDINGGKTGDYVCLKGYQFCSVIVGLGVVAATFNITVNKATAVAGTSATSFSFDAYYLNAATGTSDTFTRTTGASGTIATGATSNQLIRIDIDAVELRSGATTDYDCLAVVCSDPSGSAIVCAYYLLGNSRYMDAASPTAITD